MKVRIGTRGSDLALWQAHHVASRLESAGHEVEITVLKTRGDRIDDVPLQNVEGKAFFTAEIEQALHEQRVDLAVHSHKDLPVDDAPGLIIAAVPPRGPVGERLLIAREAHDASAALLPLRRGARVGTSSPRREEQLRTLRPDLEVLPLRGNVPTRVNRLREARYDAILLAAAGLDRLELAVDDLVAVDLSPALLVPAPAQGALALQVRADDRALRDVCRALLHDAATAAAVAAERSVLSASGGGCNLPLGCTVLPHAGAWQAEAFLGADLPASGAPPRWARATAGTPAAAAHAVAAQLATAVTGGTRCGPLAGLLVALAGSSRDGTHAGARLTALGADVVHEQILEFESLADGIEALTTELARLRPGDAVAVTSREAARRLGGHRLPPGVALCAVGPSTAAVLRERGFEVSTVGRGGALELARAMDSVVVAGQRVLFPCAIDALTDLEIALAERGVEVLRCAIYRTLPRADARLTSSADARVYMSPSAVAAGAVAERALGGDTGVRVALGRTTAEACARHELAAEVPDGRDPELVIQLLAALRAQQKFNELEAKP